ncbi:hypothetical protein PR048_019416 [Dryococelus australis]|uniref:Uncharacterized protein n=1 Tax=Dryococelus australis TaxID=614101 RepID=A0ABQ9H3T6_9NEOP|nr:hypothetical protein PR048_019416 [Dryococelus australis]
MQKPATHLESQDFDNNLKEYETAFLSLIDKTDKLVQDKTLHSLKVTKAILTLHTYLQEKRDGFEKFEEAAFELSIRETPIYPRIRKRKIFADEVHQQKKEVYAILAKHFNILPLLASPEGTKNKKLEIEVNKFKYYPQDIDDSFANECVHFKAYVDLENLKTIPELYSYIKQKTL